MAFKRSTINGIFLIIDSYAPLTFIHRTSEKELVVYLLKIMDGNIKLMVLITSNVIQFMFQSYHYAHPIYVNVREAFAENQFYAARYP